MALVVVADASEQAAGVGVVFLKDVPDGAKSADYLASGDYYWVDGGSALVADYG